MDSLNERIKLLSAELKEFLEAKFELSILKISEKVSYIVGESIQKIVGLLILTLGLLFLSIALSFYLGELVDNTALGFLFVGGFYFLVGVLFALIKPKGISRKIQNQIISEIIATLDSESAKEEQKIITLQKTNKFNDKKRSFIS
jgi:hypothetical protein